MENVLAYSFFTNRPRVNTPESVSNSGRIAACTKRAIHKSVRMTIWLAKIILPVSLLVRILDYMGILTYVAEYTTPLFKAMGLSGESSIVFLSSIFLPLYAPIAIMTSLPLTMREVTILSLMCLTSHNLPVESAIQKKTGSSFFRIAFFRIIMALVMGVFLNMVLPTEGYPSWITTGTNEIASSFSSLMEGWAISSARLIGVLLLVLSGLMFLQQILQEFNLLTLLVKPLYPVLRLFGVPKDTAFLWLIGNTLGLAYGGGVMMEEFNEGKVSKNDCRILNVHLSMCHSLVEDSMIFAALGISVFWIIFPRLLFAFVAVWGYRLFLRATSKT